MYAVDSNGFVIDIYLEVPKDKVLVVDGKPLSKSIDRIAVEQWTVYTL